MSLRPGAFEEKWAKQLVGKAAFFVVLLLGGCQAKKPQTHHVLVAYPEHWNEGERRPCFIGPAGGSTVSRGMGQPDIPQLDCDRFVQGELIHRTPAERIFALDVDFVGDFRGALESRRRYVDKETPWTCLLRGDAITCRP
jgi:hypothetical protein